MNNLYNCILFWYTNSHEIISAKTRIFSLTNAANFVEKTHIRRNQIINKHTFQYVFVCSVQEEDVSMDADHVEDEKKHGNQNSTVIGYVFSTVNQTKMILICVWILFLNKWKTLVSDVNTLIQITYFRLERLEYIDELSQKMSLFKYRI